jgi:FdrA protein
VLLVDIVLGYGACDDPAGALLEAINTVRSARGPEQPLTVIATVTGTEQDPSLAPNKSTPCSTATSS